MVEELKLAIKVDDDAIEQSLLKQFANAEKMANKVVLTFNNIDLDDKAIEAKFKEMQKMAGKNPIDLSIDKSSIEMLSAISKQLGNIFDIAKGKSIIDSSATVSEINKITQATKELNKVQTGSENIQSKSFTTKNKTEAYNQLKQTADVFKQFYGNEEAMHTKAGTEAAYAYYKAYEEALRKGVAESKLQKVTVDVDKDGFFNAERISSTRIEEFANFEKYGGEVTDLSEEISYFEKRLLKFSDAYSQIQSKLGKAPITPEIIQNIEKYVRNLEIAEARTKDADLMGFTKEDIDLYKDSANMYLGFATEDAIRENEKYISSLKEVKEEKENVDVSLSKSQISDIDSSLVEQQNKIQEELKETQKQAEQTSESLSNIGDGNKSNISSENQNKQLLEGEEIRKNLYKINDEIGLSEEEFIQKLRQENEEVKNGNRQFQERLALLKDGKVVASYFGDKASMNIHNSDLVDSFDKVIHSHSPIEGSSVPSFEDLDLIFGKYKSEVKDFVLFYNNEMRSLQAPGDMSLLGSEFRDYGKFLDAISSLTSNSSIYSNYANNYLASIAEEAGVAYKQIDALGNEINSQRINTSDWEIILETMRQLTNMHRSQNQDAEFSQIAERGKELSNTFIDSKNAAEQFEISVESLYDILIKLWKSVENDGGKTAFKQLREQLTSLSSDNIKDILYGDEMFYDADGDANELKQVAQKIYDNYYLPLINGAKELKSETNSPMKDVFQGDKIDQATTSAKELDKTLEQVNIPTDSFDEVLSKLDLAKSELGEIVKITKQSVSDSEGKFHDSYTLKDKRGSTEIYGLSSNTEKGQLLRSNIVGYDAKAEAQDSKRLVEENIRLNKAYYDSKKQEEVEYQRLRAKYLAEGKAQEEKYYADLQKYADSEVEYYKNREEEYQRLREKYKSEGKAQEEKIVKDEWDKNVKAIQDYMDAVTKLNNLNAKDKGTGKYSSQIALQEKNVEELKEKALEARTAITSMINPHDVPLNTWRDYLDVMEKFSQASIGSAESVAKLEDALRKMDFSSLESAGTKFESQFNNLSIKPDGDHQFLSWTNDLKELNAKIDEYNSKVKYLKDNNIVDGKQVEEVKNLRDEIEETINIMTKTPQAKRGWTDIGASKAAEKVANILKQNTKMSKEARDAIRAYYNELRSGNPSQPIDEILVKVNQLVQKERELGRVGKSFGEIFKEKVIYGGAAQLAGMVGFYDVINVGREIVTNIKEVDTALTELRKVSDATEQRLTTNFKNSADTAKELGATVSDVISATADWSRMGYNIDQSEELARISTLYKNVGDGIDIETANNSLISTLQGFQLDASQAESIIDKFNEVANNYAIDSAGIGEALQRSAASFNAANTDLSKSIALITATNEVVQDPDSVGKYICLPIQ